MKRILVIVPSRGRPMNVQLLIDAFAATRTDANLLVAVDNDDPLLKEYAALEMPTWASLYVGPRLRLGGTLNQLATIYADAYDIIGFMGDDHRPLTAAWDIAFSQPDGTQIMYGNDLIQGAALPTAVFMTTDIIKTLGYMVPPTMTHLFLDNFWLALGRALDRLIYMPHVIIEHVHPVAGKAQWDEGYVAVNSSEQWTADEAAWKKYLDDGTLMRDVHAIKLSW